jgi:two-component system response regulator
MPHKVLLVEDDKQNYDMMLRRLERRGYEVELAVDGEEAVEKASSMSPDLILMDIKLPNMDGLDATREIRKMPNGDGRVPIIALTAHAFTEDEDKAKKAGCDDYHAKPVAFINLVDQMEALLEGESAEEQPATDESLHA